MAMLLKSDRVRVVLLNATLLLLFASAWVSDRWPEYTLTAIVSAFIVVIGEVILLYVMAKRAASQSNSQFPVPKVVDSQRVQHDHDLPVEVLSRDVVFQRDFGDALTEHESLVLHHRYMMLHHQNNMLYALRPRASRVSTWALAALLEDQAARVVTVRNLKIARERIARELAPPISRELEKWKVVPHGDEAFNIVAGAFEIEFFHGLTNIRILDSSRVTVEGETRGVKSKAAPPNIRPARYQ